MSSSPPSAGTLLGRYRIVEKIGEGGMGFVFRAHDEQLQRDVALKILRAGTLADDAARVRFHREALAVAQLTHRNVAMALDYGQEQGIDFFVAEYVSGITLEKKLDGSALPEKTILELGTQLASGLEAAHHANIIHRDLKPGNLRLDNDGQLKILDFGLAQSVIEPTGNTVTALKLDRGSSISGTMPYMAPEQINGESADARTDLWACGAVLYEMATGARPFPQKSSTDLIYAINHEEPVAPRKLNPKISGALETVILKALDKDPERRFQSARELGVVLARIQPKAAIAPGIALTTGEKRQPTLWWIGAGMVIALAMAMITWGVWHQRQQKIVPKRQRIIAVLPFEAVGSDLSSSALGRGLTETLAAELAQASDSDMMQVVSPRDLRGRNVQTAQDARREFGTDLVLEGTLEKSGTMIRINCSLVDSATSRQIGARSFTVTDTDSFGLQDQVAAEVFALLPTQTRTAGLQSAKTGAHTNAAAYEAYVRGRGYLLDYEKPQSIDSAVAEFTRTIAIDTHYAPAYAGLGEAYWIGFRQLNKGKPWLAKASQSCGKSLALDANLPEGHTCMGTLMLGTGKYENAVEQFQRAIALGVNDEISVGGLAQAYASLGNLSAAEATYQQAINIRPKYWAVYNWMGEFYLNQARYPEAQGAFEKVTELAPDNYRGYSNLSGTYLYEGKYPEAIEAAQRSVALFPNGDAFGNLGAAYFWQHRIPEAVAVLRDALELNENDGVNWGNLAEALYFTPGGREESIKAYGKAIGLLHAALEVNPRDSATIANLAQYSAMVGDDKSAAAEIRHALELAPDDPQVLFQAALVYSHRGDVEHALAYLKKAAEAKWPRAIIRDTPEFNGLHGNARFQAIVRGG